MDKIVEAHRLTRTGRGLPTRVLVALIDAYRFLLSPLLGQHCRFHPTCSQYAREAVLTHGPLRGSLLAAGRVARCHPWSAGGIDRVPAPGPIKQPDNT